jgi:uncharacterized protein (TIGR02996 family)
VDVESVLLDAICAAPADLLAWHALADHLEERGDRRAELLRLDLRLRRQPTQWRSLQRRMQTLLGDGVRPCVPRLVNSLGMEFVLLPPGEMLMGPDYSDQWRRVRLERPVFLGACPVTQEQYVRVVGLNPSWFSPSGERAEWVDGLDTRNFPVENLAWREAIHFCERLSDLPAEKAAGRRYRLPWEVEWEYGCRAGTRSPFHFGGKATTRWGLFTWSKKLQSLCRTCSVGSYPPNAWGLHDMHGQVWEHCGEPWYETPADVQFDDATPPPPSDSPSTTVLRGGSWSNTPETCKVAVRSSCTPGFCSGWVGLRVVLVPAT